MSSRPFAVVTAASLLFLGCPKKDDAGGRASADGAAASASASTDAGPSATASDGGGKPGDDVESVYPVDPNAPPDPLAQKLCAGLSDMPEKKRAECCKTTPGIVVTSECTRTLSAALRMKAVTLEPAAVDTCIAAFEKTLDGCDWVGPFPPGPPAACQGLVQGKLGIGQRCRSTLECTGALRCKGVGPTTPGKCSGPTNSGESCGGTVDALATYVRQNDIDKEHPECAAGRCIKHRCAGPVAENGECSVTLDCDDGLQCIVSGPAAKPKKGDRSALAPPRKCVRRGLPGEGEACPGGVCAEGLGCIMSKCTARKASGAACENDFECKGGCLKPGGAVRGTCGPRCDIR